MNPHVPRVGTFFILIGGGLFCLFMLMLFGKQFQVIYFLLSVVLIFIGFRLRGKPAPPPRSGRFGIINKSREQMRKSKEMREKKRQEREAQKKKK